MQNGDKPIDATLTYNDITGNPNGHFIGLTKREHFAALAMQGLLAHNDSVDEMKIIASDAVKLADALLKALEDPHEQ
jgi:hypothetical protein